MERERKELRYSAHIHTCTCNYMYMSCIYIYLNVFAAALCRAQVGKKVKQLQKTRKVVTHQLMPHLTEVKIHVHLHQGPIMSNIIYMYSTCRLCNIILLIMECTSFVCHNCH